LYLRFIIYDLQFTIDCSSFKEKRPVALPTSLFIFMTTCYGFVSRDFYNPELRHHQMLNIVAIAFCLVSFVFGSKGNHYSLNPQTFQGIFLKIERNIVILPTN